MSDKKSFGQYFTPDYVADYMVSLISKEKSEKVLEPSAGEGVFLSALQKANFSNLIGYEIDNNLENISNAPIKYESFVSKKFDEQFDVIIGNPPYIRWKNLDTALKDELLTNQLWNKYFNSLCDYLYIFILKSIELLQNGGELIFITPEYWMHTTHSMNLRNYMIDNGYFETIVHFKEAPIFDKVASSIVIFKYVKSKVNVPDMIKYVEYETNKKLTASMLSKVSQGEFIEGWKYFEIGQFKKNSKWLFASDDIVTELMNFELHCSKNNYIESNLMNETLITLGQISDIGNGMVSGLDKAFQLPNDMILNEIETLSTIEVLKAKSLERYAHNESVRYIFLTDNLLTEVAFEEKYPNFYKHMCDFREDLSNRYNYNRDIKYWEWVFLRNQKLFSQQVAKIFVPCKERISHKEYIRFAYAEPNVFPTQDVSAIYIKPYVKESVFYILALLNNFRTYHWLKYNGIMKGNILEFSEKPTSQIPIRLINWNDENEVNLHTQITDLTAEYINTKNLETLSKIECTIDLLFQ